MRSDIYQLQCHTCYHYYIGQTGRRLEQNIKNISDTSHPVTPPSRLMHFTFSTTIAITDPWTSTRPYSTQSIEVDERTH
jgi:hypothetical protein